MRDTTIARNYAEALFTLAQRANDLRGWGELLHSLTSAIEKEPTLRVFLESPRVDPALKSQVLGRALGERYPALFVRYLQALIRNRRQMLLGEIAHEYMTLVDEAEGRLHATVTVAMEPDDAVRAVIVRELSRAVGKTVVPHFTVDPRLIGGVVVRVGDTVLDGSVRRRLGTLRSRMLTPRS